MENNKSKSELKHMGPLVIIWVQNCKANQYIGMLQKESNILEKLVLSGN